MFYATNSWCRFRVFFPLQRTILQQILQQNLNIIRPNFAVTSVVGLCIVVENTNNDINHSKKIQVIIRNVPSK